MSCRLVVAALLPWLVAAQGATAATPAPSAVQPPSSTVQKLPPAPKPAATPATTSCSCSGTKLCVGPRGGRYCITSGGKKRYTH